MRKKKKLNKEAVLFRQQLKLANMKQVEFANLIDYSPRQINLYAQGKASPPKLVQLALDNILTLKGARK